MKKLGSAAFLVLAAAGAARGVPAEDDPRAGLQEPALFEELCSRDLAGGRAEAGRTGKPLLVVLRCVP